MARKKAIKQETIFIEPALLPHLMVRCRHKDCRQFVMQAQAAMLGCAVCDWHTVFCHDCGGDVAAQRGVLSHVSHFASNKKALEKYGQAHRVLVQAVYPIGKAASRKAA